MSVIGPVQSHYHEDSPVGKRSLRWEGFVDMSEINRLRITAHGQRGGLANLAYWYVCQFGTKLQIYRATC